MNVRGVANLETRARKLHHLKVSGIDIAVLTEVQGEKSLKGRIGWSEKLNKKEEVVGSVLTNMEHNGNARTHPWSLKAGIQGVWSCHVAIVAFTDKVKIRFKECSLGGRVLVATVEREDAPAITIMGLYLNAQPKAQREDWSHLHQILVDPRTLVLGDFNCYMNEMRDTTPPKAAHSNGSRMRDWFELNGLVDMVSEEADAVSIMTRWNLFGSTLSGSRIDHALVTGDMLEEFTTSSVREAHISDHMLLYTDWKGEKSCAPEDRRWSISHTVYKSSEWIKKMEKVIEPISLRVLGEEVIEPSFLIRNGLILKTSLKKKVKNLKMKKKIVKRKS